MASQPPAVAPRRVGSKSGDGGCHGHERTGIRPQPPPPRRTASTPKREWREGGGDGVEGRGRRRQPPPPRWSASQTCRDWGEGGGHGGEGGERRPRPSPPRRTAPKPSAAVKATTVTTPAIAGARCWRYNFPPWRCAASAARVETVAATAARGQGNGHSHQGRDGQRRRPSGSGETVAATAVRGVGDGLNRLCYGGQRQRPAESGGNVAATAGRGVENDQNRHRCDGKRPRGAWRREQRQPSRQPWRACADGHTTAAAGTDSVDDHRGRDTHDFHHARDGGCTVMTPLPP